jgi:hypothetical protein
MFHYYQGYYFEDLHIVRSKHWRFLAVIPRLQYRASRYGVWSLRVLLDVAVIKVKEEVLSVRPQGYPTGFV